MGCTQSRAIESPFLLGSLLETTKEDIFLGASPTVTLTASLDNDTSHKVVFKGCYLRKGSQAPLHKSATSVNSNSRENLILAAMNSEKFSEILRGTNGLALWKVEGTEYVMVLAWKIPKYRKVLKQSNTIAFGLLLNRFGKFDHSSSINFELYQKVMKNGPKLKPNMSENHGNFVRMSCKNLTAGEEISGVIRNKNLQLTASLTSGRSARVHLTLTKNSKPVNALHRMGEAEILQSLMKVPSVTFITSLQNNTSNGIEYQGCYLKRGYHLDTNADITKELNGSDSDNIFAAINSKPLRGTNGVALWKITNTEYVLVLAWKIPKYRKLLNQTNTISFGLLLNTNGHYNHSLNINADLYKEVMKSPGRLEPRTFADCGNFVQMSCLETSSGGVTSMTFQNNRFKMVAQLTSGRSARCHLVLDAVKTPINPPDSSSLESRNIQLLAFKKCFCDSCEFENVPCDGSGNAVGLLIDNPNDEEFKTYLGAGTSKEPNLHICSMKIEEFDLKALLLHRLKCNRYHDQRYISTYKVGQIRVHPEDLNYCSSQNPITSQVYKSAGNQSVKWLVQQIRLLAIDKLYPHVLELLKMNLDRLINYKVEGEAVDPSKILAQHFEPVMETLSIQKMKPMPRPRWHIRPPWYKSSNVMLIEQMKTFLEKS